MYVLQKDKTTWPHIGKTSGWELFVLHTLFSMFGKFWCMLGDNVEV